MNKALTGIYMKRVFKITVITLVVLLLSLGAFLYFHTRRAINIIIPEFEKIEHVDISFLKDSLLLNADVRFENKSFLKLDIDSLIYSVKLDTLTLLSRAQILKAEFSPGQTDTLQLPVYLPFKRLSGEIKNRQHTDSMPVTFDLRLVYSTWFGRASLPYKKRLNVAVPIPPEFVIQKFAFRDRHKNQFHFEAFVKIINKGKLELHVSNMKYKAVVKDNLKAEGSDTREFHLSPGSEKIITIPVTVEFDHLFKTQVNIISDNDKISYYLTISAMVSLDKLSKEKTEIRIEKSGNTELKE